MQFKRTVFKADIYGEQVEIKKLNAESVDAYQKELTECKEDDVKKVIFGMLSKQGLPKKIASKMELDHLQEIISAVTGASVGK
jgi:predicted CopG family antitoxin